MYTLATSMFAVRWIAYVGGSLRCPLTDILMGEGKSKQKSRR